MFHVFEMARCDLRFEKPSYPDVSKLIGLFRE